MSGLEVISVLASTSQLVRYILEIIDYTQNISKSVKGTSCPFQQHTQHLQALVATVRTISQTPLLQTSLINNHLESLLNRAETLRSHLKRYIVVLPQTSLRKVWTALLAHKAESQILKDLATLERDKSNLLLCIASSYGIVLNDIKQRTDSNFTSRIDNMPSSKAKQSSDKQPYQATEKAFDRMSPRSSRRQNNGVTHGEPQDEECRKEQLESEEASCQGSTSSATGADSTNPRLDPRGLSGNVFYKNYGKDQRGVINRPGAGDNQGPRRDYFEGNCSVGKGSRTLNGPATREELKDFWKG